MTIKSIPSIAIIGRPNVGKSSIFNRIVGYRKSLVHDQAGVTRDRIESECTMYAEGVGYSLKMIDTGGLGGDFFAEEIHAQVQAALKDADGVLFVLDAREGLTHFDKEALRQLRVGSKTSLKNKIVFVLNKADNDALREFVPEELYQLTDEPVFVSASHNIGFETLKERMVSQFKLTPRDTEDTEEVNDLSQDNDSDIAQSEVLKTRSSRVPRVALVGRPNVGKSTLTNFLVGQDRVIVSDRAGTTSDSIEVPCTIDGKAVVLIDTAGVRRKSKTEQGVEVLSVVQTKKALENADVACLVIDAEVGVTDQDAKVGAEIEESGSSVILIVNKWDLKNQELKLTKEKAAEYIREKFPFLKYAPIVFGSGLKGEGFLHLGNLIYDVLEARKIQIPTREYTEWIKEASRIHNPKNVKFYMSHQSGRHPPTFVLHVSQPKNVEDNLKRNILNQMRERWGFMGTPIRLVVVKGGGDRRARKD